MDEALAARREADGVIEPLIRRRTPDGSPGRFPVTPAEGTSLARVGVDWDFRAERSPIGCILLLRAMSGVLLAQERQLVL